MNPVTRLVKHAGGQTKLARLVGVSPQLVYLWLQKGRVPYNRVLDLEAKTGISRHELRPDLYPEDNRASVEIVEDLAGSRNIPFVEIVKLYHEILPELRRCVKITTARKAQIRARVRDQDVSDLGDWRVFFERVKASKFLTGKVAGNGRKPFKADLGWLTKEANFVSILEGKYD